jgi:hypothetical protein
MTPGTIKRAISQMIQVTLGFRHPANGFILFPGAGGTIVRTAVVMVSVVVEFGATGFGENEQLAFAGKPLHAIATG